MQIEGRTFLVTGGSSGLGAAVVQRLVANGGRAIIADVNQAGGEALAAELGQQARFVFTDVNHESQVQAAVGTAVDVFGGLHGVVNCAGIALAARVLNKSKEDNQITPHNLDHFAKVIAVNLIGTFNVIRLAAAAMAANEPNEEGERGVIVNTASVAAFDGQIGQAAYSASKGGIVAMTLPIAREVARYGIRVMTIAPGVFDTPILGGFRDRVESLAQQVPFPPRLGRPEEFAALVQHIVENVMLNGEVIRLDGAIRMAPK